MKTSFNKIVSMIVIAAVASSQIGCIGKTTKVSMPLDQINFDQGYEYTVRLKDGKGGVKLPENQEPSKTDSIEVNTKSGTKSLMAKDIKYIEKIKLEEKGTYATRGLLIGAITGSVVLGLSTMVLSQAVCEGGPQCRSPGFGFLLGGSIGAGAGGIIGLGVGAMIPKYKNKFQITPVINQSENGVDTGLNLGFNF